MSHDHEDDVDTWNARYRARTAPWDPEPNPQLESVVADLPPGDALDVGCGEGSDSVWLADRGWRVTGVDIAEAALDRGRAADPAGRVTWVPGDMRDWTPAPASFDLVSAHFLHFSGVDRKRVYGKLAAAVRPGGLLLVVAHHPSDLDNAQAGRWGTRDHFFTAEELAGDLDLAGWDVVLSEKRPRTANTHHGHGVHVHDTVLAVRRRA